MTGWTRYSVLERMEIRERWFVEDKDVAKIRAAIWHKNKKGKGSWKVTRVNRAYYLERTG